MRLANGSTTGPTSLDPTRVGGPGPRALRPALAACLLLGLAGCANYANPLGPYFGGDAPAAAPVMNETQDSRGVIAYASYQVVVARDGDTIATVASRLGIPPEQLASRNSLPTDYRLRAGEVLLLPDSFPRSAPGGALGGDVSTQTLGGTAWSPERASQAINSGATATPPTANPFQNGQSEPLIDPVRHRVEAGETAYSIARLYGVSVTALASWNGLGPDLTVRQNQELLIPIVSGANRISDTDTQPGQGTAVAPPPSAAAPLPENIEQAETPASPDLGQYRTPQGGRLAAPVSAPVSRPYDAGSATPDGVGYAVAAGTPVKAAGAGEVALISEGIDGVGRIVLIRHRDDLTTAYSTLSDLRVEKGDAVQAGQVIGVVAVRDRPELQFDVFRGTTSVDPATYLPR